MKKIFTLVLIALSLSACMGQNNNSANNEAASKYYDEESSYYVANSQKDGTPAVWVLIQDDVEVVTSNDWYDFFTYKSCGWFAEDFSRSDLTITGVTKSIIDSDFIYIHSRTFPTAIFDTRSKLAMPFYGTFVGEVTKGKYSGSYVWGFGNGVTICAIPDIIAIDTTHVTYAEIEIKYNLDYNTPKAILCNIINDIENIKL